MVFLRDCSTAVRLVQQELEIVVALMAGVLQDQVREPPDIDLGRPWTRPGVGVLDSELVAKPLAREKAAMKSKTFTTTIVRDGSMCFIPVTFDPREVFGKIRAPVKVTLNGFTYRSTIAAMGGPPCIPLRKSNREAAGLEGNETVEVRLDLDTDKREVKPPADLAKALKSSPALWKHWQELSYSHQREHVDFVEQAKKLETRIRRIERVIEMISARPHESTTRRAASRRATPR